MAVLLGTRRGRDVIALTDATTLVVPAGGWITFLMGHPGAMLRRLETAYRACWTSTAAASPTASAPNAVWRSP